MPVWSYIFLGLTLPWLAGASLVYLLSQKASSPSRTSFVVSGGFLFGVALASASTLLAQQIGLPRLPSAISLLTAVTIISAVLIGRRQWTSTIYRASARSHEPILIAVLVLITVALFWHAASNLLHSPTFPWDAWETWSHKARAWFFHDQGAPHFLPDGRWLAAGPNDDSFALVAHHYPMLVGGYQVYLASIMDGWLEPYVNLPWLLMAINLVLAAYGFAREAGVSARLAMATAVSLAMMPLLQTHVALAGYMDLWMAYALLLLTWQAWRMQHQAFGWRAGLLLLTLFLIGTNTKVEGLIWGVAVLAALFAEAISWRLVLGVFLATLCLFVVGLVVGVSWPSEDPMLVINSERLWLPYVGRLNLALTNNLDVVLNSMIASRNWLLQFYLLIGGLGFLLWRRRGAFTEQRLLVGLSIFAVLALAFLFFVTSAATWAKDLTTLNRQLLQWLPVWTLTVAICCFGRPGSRTADQSPAP